jgi:hypothetical protein
MLKIFSPEKYEVFSRERTRDVGYQWPACAYVGEERLVLVFGGGT